jgi:hypothetical protein
MYGIKRIDQAASGTHSWHVTIQRRRRIWTRHFTDRVYGGREKALAAAKAFRDQLIARYPALSRRAFCSIRKKNNRSGISGVTRIEGYQLHRGRKQLRVYWVAQWPIGPGRARQKKFSVRIYGEREAFRLALRARRQGLRALRNEPWREGYSRSRSTKA